MNQAQASKPQAAPRTARPHPLGRRSLTLIWDAHTVAGVLMGPLLLVIFVTAILLPVHDELLAWSDPFVRSGASGAGFSEVFAPVGDDVVASKISIHLPDGVGGLAEVDVKTAEGDSTWWVDGASGAFVPERSHVARDIFYLHFFYHVPYGMYGAGIVGLILSLSLLSGVLLHLRDMVPQFGRLRPSPPRARRADFHTLLGTLLALPLLVLTVTGAMLAVARVVVALHTQTTFDGDQARATMEVGFDRPKPQGEAKPNDLPDVSRAIAVADARIGGLKPHSVTMDKPGADDATIRVYGATTDAFALPATVVMDAHSYEILRVHESSTDTPATVINMWGVSLHFGRWAGLWSRLLYIPIAIGSVAITVFGLSLWRMRRRESAFARGVEVATVVSTAGLGVALGVSLVGGLLIPLDLASRPALQTQLLFLSWAATIPVAARFSGITASRFLLAATVALFVLAAALSLGITAPSSASLALQGRPAMLAIDALLLFVAAGTWAARQRLPAEVTP